MHKVLLNVGILIAAFAIVTTKVTVGTAYAHEKTIKCHGIQNEASLTSSDKLILSVASSRVKKYCHFFVSMPPPFTTKKSVELWYKSRAALDRPKRLVQPIIDIALAPVPKGDPASKALVSRIEDNADLIAECVTALLNGGDFHTSSKDKSLRCMVPSSAAGLLLTVALADAFKSSVWLPSPLL